MSKSESFSDNFQYKETVKDIFASVVGSAACVYTGQPFDTIKVRMQVNQQMFYASPLDCFKKTLKAEGIVSFWKGSVPAFLGALSENAVAFSVNGFLKRFRSELFNGNNFYISQNVEPYFTGGITGFFSAFALCPCDVVKCVAQVNTANGLQRQSFSQVVQSIIETRGILGLYRGIGAQLLRDVPFYSSFFGSYEVMCKYFKAIYPNAPDTYIYFMAGGFAGQIGWVVSIAPDVVKSTIQTTEPAQSIWKTSRNIYATNGLKGFFSGIEVAIIRAFPANAALFVAYELTREILNDF